jgi:hypothetical protein
MPKEWGCVSYASGSLPRQEEQEAMTTNQTIDGVLRDLEKAMSYYFGAKEVRNFKIYLRREFKPARSKTTARTIELSLGQVERAYDTAMVSGNRDLADELRGLLKAESAPFAESQVEPAAQSQGEPVAWLILSDSVIPGFQGHREVVLKDPGRLDAVVTPLYAEQPAPVAVDALSTGFYVTETGGGRYAINIGFRSMADMQAADAQLRELLKSR